LKGFSVSGEPATTVLSIQFADIKYIDISKEIVKSKVQSTLTTFPKRQLHLYKYINLGRITICCSYLDGIFSAELPCKEQTLSKVPNLSFYSNGNNASK
jgi:hypothetical protein